LPAASVPAGCGTTGCLLTIGKGGASDRALLAPLTLAAQPGHEMPEHIIEQSRELYARTCLRACEERVAANEGRLDLLELPGRQIVVLGSVTVKVLTHSNIPVLVYR
jgi:nucleotide-binding universal stress UspA family protein